MEDCGLSKEELERALKFEGYGNKSAPFWFIGMEEGGGSIEELRKRVRLYDPVEDLHAAHKKLGIGNNRYVPTWRLVSMLIMAIQGMSGWRERSSAQTYQVTKLGRADGDTFLAELMPLPSRSIGVWPYEAIWPSRKEYYSDVRPSRIKWLHSEFAKIQPRFVICYGKGNWRYYKDIFSDVDFKPKLNEKIRVGQRDPSTILLLPFLSFYFINEALIAQIADLIRRDHDEE